MILTDYLINGQNLTGEHASLIVGTTHFTSISPRINSVTVNGRSGVMLPAGPLAFDAPEITLKFITNGPDADTLMHRFYRLCRLASSLTRMERDTSTGLTRRMTASAVCTSCEADGDEIPWSNHRAATAVFQLPDVYWQGDWQTASLPAAGGVFPLRQGSDRQRGLVFQRSTAQSHPPLLKCLIGDGDRSSDRHGHQMERRQCVESLFGRLQPSCMDSRQHHIMVRWLRCDGRHRLDERAAAGVAVCRFGQLYDSGQAVRTSAVTCRFKPSWE